jgi:hypothetical protein
MKPKKLPRLLIAIGFLFSCHALSSTCLAQDLPPPPPAKDYFPNLWKDFTSTEGGFKVRFPGDPKESVEPRPNSTALHALWYGSGQLIYYSVNYRDLTNPPTNQTEVRKLLKSVRDTRMTGFEDRMKLLAEEEITRDGYPALILEIQLFDNRRLRELDVIRGARQYQIKVITFSNHKAMGSDNAYGEIAKSFLDSFHLIEAAPK